MSFARRIWGASVFFFMLLLLLSTVALNLGIIERASDLFPDLKTQPSSTSPTSIYITLLIAYSYAVSAALLTESLRWTEIMQATGRRRRLLFTVGIAIAAVTCAVHFYIVFEGFNRLNSRELLGSLLTDHEDSYFGPDSLYWHSYLMTVIMPLLMFSFAFGLHDLKNAFLPGDGVADKPSTGRLWPVLAGLILLPVSLYFFVALKPILQVPIQETVLMGRGHTATLAFMMVWTATGIIMIHQLIHFRTSRAPVLILSILVYLVLYFDANFLSIHRLVLIDDKQVLHDLLSGVPIDAQKQQLRVMDHIMELSMLNLHYLSLPAPGLLTAGLQGVIHRR